MGTMDNEDLWQATLADIELQLTPANFTTWFRNTSVSSQRDSEVVVCVPNGFTKTWLEDRYNKVVLKALRNIAPSIRGVRYTVQARRGTPSAIKTKRQTTERESAISAAEEVVNQESFEALAIDKTTGLNPRYTFDSFIVGSFNELAHAAAEAITKRPGDPSYNPLFIYGGVGLGKTHLLQAVGNTLHKAGKVVRYISSERFTSELVSSLNNHRMSEFKEKYRKIDVLIVDDIQFLGRKDKSQEEFFYTFNALYENNKQLILSADRTPKSISGLEERLCSRFEGGMITDVSFPELETRIAILKQRCQERGAVVADEVLGYIAEYIQKNVRELEGALNLVLASTRTKSEAISEEDVKKILKHIISRPKKVVTPKRVIQTIAGFYEVSEKDLLGKNRRKEIAHPRQVAMYIMRNTLKNSYPFIGSKIGGRDHTTIMHACDKIGEAIKVDDILREEMDLITHQLYSE